MEILVLFHFLNHHHSAVGSSNHRLLHIAVEETDGTTEKIHRNTVENRTDGKHNPEGRQRIVSQKIEKERVKHSDYNQTPCENLESFTMKTYIF